MPSRYCPRQRLVPFLYCSKMPVHSWLSRIVKTCAVVTFSSDAPVRYPSDINGSASSVEMSSTRDVRIWCGLYTDSSKGCWLQMRRGRRHVSVVTMLKGLAMCCPSLMSPCIFVRTSKRHGRGWLLPSLLSLSASLINCVLIESTSSCSESEK